LVRTQFSAAWSVWAAVNFCDSATLIVLIEMWTAPLCRLLAMPASPGGGHADVVASFVLIREDQKTE
jgi:hypothetical protein